MKALYILYQIFIALPILLVLTILTALVTIVGSWIGDPHVWGYYPGKIWSQLFCYVLLIPVKVVGHPEVLDKTSYVFVANHQGSFDVLQNGTSLVVFPEGARTFTGHMGYFKKGAFQLADELQLPVVPLTIVGSFNVLPRTGGFVSWHPMTLIIHKPIYPQSQGIDNIKTTMEEAYKEIEKSLPEEYQGKVNNPDQ